MQLDKRLPGGCQIQVWDQHVSLGRLVGSNQQFIEEVIPHIGSLLCTSLRVVLETAEVVLVETRVVKKEPHRAYLRPDQVVIDLVNLEKFRRLNRLARHEGICW